MPNLYGLCIRCESPATHAVVFKCGAFMPANDRGGVDRMTVAIADIVYCLTCARMASAEANALPIPADDLGCDHCNGPAHYRVSGNMTGVRCVGHVQQFLRGRSADFYSVEPL
ncbi:MAG: hypothetical protein AMXMBFR23_15310 [Chloroflexota bacterium]